MSPLSPVAGGEGWGVRGTASRRIPTPSPRPSPPSRGERGKVHGEPWFPGLRPGLTEAPLQGENKHPMHDVPDTAPPVPPSAYRMPAEWEPHEATWIAWPHQRDDWPGKFEAIPWVYAEIVRHLHASESVRILVNDACAEQRA